MKATPLIFFFILFFAATILAQNVNDNNNKVEGSMSSPLMMFSGDIEEKPDEKSNFRSINEYNNRSTINNPSQIQRGTSDLEISENRRGDEDEDSSPTTISKAINFNTTTRNLDHPESPSLDNNYNMNISRLSDISSNQESLESKASLTPCFKTGFEKLGIRTTDAIPSVDWTEEHLAHQLLKESTIGNELKEAREEKEEEDLNDHDIAVRASNKARFSCAADSTKIEHLSLIDISNEEVKAIEIGLKKASSSESGSILAFDPSLPPETEKASSYCIRSKLTQKLLSPEEEANTKKLNKYSRCFKKIISGIEIAIDDIPEDDPERASKTAALYAESYLKIKENLKKSIITIENDPLLQDKKALRLLCYNSIEFIKIASLTIDPASIKPIKTSVRFLAYLDDKKLITIVSNVLNYGNIDPNQIIQLADRKADLMLQSADNTIANLKGIGYIFNIQNNDIVAKTLHDEQIQRAMRAYHIASEQHNICRDKNRPLFYSRINHSIELEQIQQEAIVEENKSSQYAKECREAYEKMKKENFDLLPDEENRVIIADTLAVVKEALNIAENLKIMLESRQTIIISEER